MKPSQMRPLFLTLGILLALVAPTQAQTAGGGISGSVVDESGAILPGASVTLSGPGVNKTAITGADGKYEFANLAAGTYTVTMHLAGFGSVPKPGVVVAGARVEIPAVTLAIALRGEEVVVTASKIETSLVDAPATMSVVSSETIAASPAQNYGDLLRSVPGLNVIQMSARDINLTSRQATSTLSNSQLALLDGRSIYLDFFGLILWDFVPSNPADIKQIEVVRGPASAVWGANALTGVVNIITKSPREAPGGSITFTGGFFSRDVGDSVGQSAGKSFGGNLSYAGAPNDRWSYRISGGYFDSDAYARPTGLIPLTTHPLDATLKEGGARYPDFASALGTGVHNQGTKQPKADLRVDQALGNGGVINYSAGYAGTQGLIHTGIGPFDLQNGSYLGFGRVAYAKGGLKIAAFANLLDAKAPNLLSVDVNGVPVPLNTKSKTFDLEAGNTNLVAQRHILSYGANARRNNFDISTAPTAKDRNEFGAYFQDEIFFDKFRFALGGRVDKFGNLKDPVFSPRLSANFKPSRNHSIRVAFNKAFRSPSTINNFLDSTIAVPVNLGALVTALGPLGPLVRPILAPAANGGLFPLSVRAAGNELLGGVAGYDNTLKQESLTAYEIGYTGTFNARTTVGIAYYINDTDNNINFITAPRNPAFFYSAANLPPGFERLPSLPRAALGLPGPGVVPLGVVLLAGPLAERLPSIFTYQNIGKIRNQGLEVSIDHAFSRQVSAIASYTYQKDPEPRDPVGDRNRYPTSEISLGPTNHFNAGINVNSKRFIGSASVNYASNAFWTDVLGDEFHGRTDSFTLVNASVGLKWMDAKLTTAVKVNNLLNQDVLQHVFGDFIKRTVTGEVRYTF